MNKVWYDDFTPGELRVLKDLGSTSGNSPRVRQKISESLMGHSVSLDTRRRISEANAGRVFSEEHKRNLSEALMGRSLSEEHKRKVSEGLRLSLSLVPPEEMKRRLERGLHSPEARKKASESRIGHVVSEELKERISKANMGNRYFAGKTHSKEVRERISKAHKGKVVSEYTRRRLSKACKEAWEGLSDKEKESRLRNSYNSEEARAKALISRRRYWEIPENRHRHSNILKDFWANMTPEELQRRSRHYPQQPTLEERYLGRQLDREFPDEWRYNGKGEEGVIIGGRIPDFVNINGRKEVMEMFGTYWHPESDEGERIVHYAKWGYRCIVIWDYEVWSGEWKEKVKEAKR